MKGFKVERKFRGADYIIEVDNSAGVQKGIKELTIDGKKLDGNILPVYSDGKKHIIKAIMG